MQIGQAKKKTNPKVRLFYLAERTGLEPATPGVTGRYSNQLNYRSKNCSMCVTTSEGPEVYRKYFVLATASRKMT